MDIFQLKIEESGWYIVPCLLLSALYAYLHYHQTGDFTKSVKHSLITLRFLTVFLISFLLLSPYINYTKNIVENPVIAIVVDNSSSVTLEQKNTYIENLKNSLKNIEIQLSNKEITATFLDLEDFATLDSIRFEAEETNLSKALKNTSESFINRNLAAVVLVSDGIHNTGLSPEFIHLNTPVYTLGIGDTSSKSDIAISDIKINKTAFLNNDFPIKVDFKHHGYGGKKIKLDLLKKDSLISSKEITLNNSGYQNHTFYSSDKREGTAEYTVKIHPLEGEITIKNNIKKAFIEIIDNKEKILLYTQAPHPDIKVFRNIVDKLEKYELDVYIDGVSNAVLNIDKYQLIIAHQVPAIGKSSNHLSSILRSNTPKLFIVGNQTDLAAFSNNNRTLSITGNNQQKDEVQAYLLPTFDKFKVDAAYISGVLEGIPPLTVPFADYTTKGNTFTLLSQRVGAVKTEKPLFILQQTNDFKEGVLVGDGYWRWPLFEYTDNQEQKLLDELISKTVQFLASKDDKRNLLVTPVRTEYFTSEPIELEIRTFNELLEPISNIAVKVDVFENKQKIKQYTFSSNEHNTRYSLEKFPEGTYTFQANAHFLNKKHTHQGAFTVKTKQFEEFDLQANHHLLRQIASNNQGKFYHESNLNALIDSLLSRDFKKIIHSQETNKPLRSTWWYLLTIAGLLTTEWVLRKAKGNRI